MPKVDKYNGLGRLRTEADMDAEYHRLLERDRNPFAFLYSGMYNPQVHTLAGVEDAAERWIVRRMYAHKCGELLDDRDR